MIGAIRFGMMNFFWKLQIEWSLWQSTVIETPAGPFEKLFVRELDASD